MFGKKKLKPGEINRALDRIREEFNDIIVRYSKPLRIKEAFEERYLQALQSRMDMEQFIYAEMSAIEELRKKEEDRLSRSRNMETFKQMHKEKLDFADRVLQEFRARIEGYPEISIHKDASYEIVKLFGALGRFEEDFWPSLDKIFRAAYPLRHNSPWPRIESRMWTYCAAYEGKLPAVLERYRFLLSASHRDHKQVENEEKRIMIEIAFFLHELLGLLNTVVKEETMPVEDKPLVEKAGAAVKKFLYDFRLNEFKPK